MAGRTAQGRIPLLGSEGMRFSVPEGAGLSLVGLPPTARALVLLDMFRATGSPLVVVVRSDSESESLARDLRGLAALTGAIEPASISIFPALDADPYDGLAAHMGAVCERVRALWRLMQAEPGITVMPARALMVPLPPVSLLRPYFIEVAEGERFAQADDPRWFTSSGYRRVDLVTEPGDYSRRGGILDIYAPVLENPARIELDGDVVVSMRQFNPGDQRSTGRVMSATISPARETILGTAELDNLRSALARNAGGRRLAELIETTGSIPGIEACARLLYPSATGLLEFIVSASRGASTCEGAGPRVICDELEMTMEELRQHRAELARAAEAAGGESSGLPDPERLMLPAANLDAMLRGAPVRLRQLDITGEDDEDGGPPREVVRFKASAVPSYRGRLADLMELIRSERGAGRTVCVVMKSEGRVHRMKSLLADNDLAAVEITQGAAPSAEEIDAGLLLGAAEIGAGFTLPEAGLTVIAEHEIFGEEVRHCHPNLRSDVISVEPQWQWPAR